MNASGAVSPGSRLGAAGLIALLVASLVLGLLVYRARTPDLALEVTKLPREFRAPAAEIEFFVRFDSPEATVEIVGRDQVVAKTLASPLALEANEPVTCTWDAVGDDGRRVDPGRYRLRVTLPSEDREMVFPRRITVKADPGNGPDALQIGDSCQQKDGE